MSTLKLTNGTSMAQEEAARSDGGTEGQPSARGSEDSSSRFSRSALLRRAAAGVTAAVAGAIAVGVAGSSVAKAATNDPTLLGNSGNTVNPNLAEDATEVQFDGAAPPGVVFLAQADNKWSPGAAGFPAALAGWTSTNPNVPNGVYGYSEHPQGNAVVGWSLANVGGAFAGRNRAPLNLYPENVPAPPATGQAGDLYVTINVDGFATLWFNTGVTGWRQVALM